MYVYARKSSNSWKIVTKDTIKPSGYPIRIIIYLSIYLMIRLNICNHLRFMLYYTDENGTFSLNCGSDLDFIWQMEGSRKISTHRLKIIKIYCIIQNETCGGVCASPTSHPQVSKSERDRETERWNERARKRDRELRIIGYLCIWAGKS